MLQEKVDEILRRAKSSFDRKHYDRAAVDAWNAYQLDRRREDARVLYLEARRLRHVQFDDWFREEKLERLTRLNEEMHRMLIPQSDLLVFPEDWFRRSLRTADSLVESENEHGARPFKTNWNKKSPSILSKTPWKRSSFCAAPPMLTL